MDWSKVVDAPDFSDCVNNQTIEAKVVSVYDGDKGLIRVGIGGF